MNIAETANLLTAIQAFDNRKVDEVTIKNWHALLEKHAFSDCYAAVTAHYTSSKGWIMPADIVARVRDTEEARLGTFQHGLRLREDDHDALTGAVWGEAMRGLQHAARTGELTPEAYDAYLSGRVQLSTTIRRKGIEA